jgi:hypothetical protein
MLELNAFRSWYSQALELGHAGSQWEVPTPDLLVKAQVYDVQRESKTAARGCNMLVQNVILYRYDLSGIPVVARTTYCANHVMCATLTSTCGAPGDANHQSLSVAETTI